MTRFKLIPIVLITATLMLLVGCGGNSESLPDVEATVEAKIETVLTAIPTPTQATPTPKATSTAAGEAEITARMRLSVALGITDQETLTVYSTESLDWSDASLGCPEPGYSYAQVITPGYRITFDVEGVHYKVHTNLSGSSTVLCNEPATPHVEPTVTTVPLRSEEDSLVISFSSETKARYRVNEQLAKLNLPQDAVGVTSAVTGMVTFDAEGKVIPEKSKITIDASTLKSDENRRDNRIRKDILQTNQFPTITFVIRKTPDLTWPLPGSGDELFELVGDLVIRDVTKEIAWDVSATFTPNRIQGLAETSFTFGDFELDKPSALFLLSVEDLIRLELDFVAIYP